MFPGKDKVEGSAPQWQFEFAGADEWVPPRQTSILGRRCCLKLYHIELSHRIAESVSTPLTGIICRTESYVGTVFAQRLALIDRGKFNCGVGGRRRDDQMKPSTCQAECS